MRKGALDRRLMVSVDAMGYGSANNSRQRAMQEALIGALDEAAEATDLRRHHWIRQPGGDGELAVLPPDVPENVLIDDFVVQLDRWLSRYNEDLLPAARLRLRLALHHGVASPSRNGFVGDGVLTVSRLVASPVARHAQFAAPEASLVLIMSNRVFLETVAQRHTSLRVDQLRQVTVKVKEYQDQGWLYVPGFDVHALDLSDSSEPTGTTEAPRQTGSTPLNSAPATPQRQPEPTSRTTRSYRAEVISEFHSPVTAGVIGIDKSNRDG